MQYWDVYSVVCVLCFFYYFWFCSIYPLYVFHLTKLRFHPIIPPHSQTNQIKINVFLFIPFNSDKFSNLYTTHWLCDYTAWARGIFGCGFLNIVMRLFPHSRHYIVEMNIVWTRINVRPRIISILMVLDGLQFLKLNFISEYWVVCTVRVYAQTRIEQTSLSDTIYANGRQHLV